ncbi:hypothetical protein ZHAS_00007454 [Anopheles sinensis]|uniref:Uncharacterized protein n=1 Tax=Anopheles sinensis TaxID=74873 RepID=A0A084VP65_ANOSI|nr:hypothetical protein ZHAS_00007454 [Anopheles sinensis]
MKQYVELETMARMEGKSVQFENALSGEETRHQFRSLTSGMGSPHRHMFSARFSLRNETDVLRMPNSSSSAGQGQGGKWKKT